MRGSLTVIAILLLGFASAGVLLGLSPRKPKGQETPKPEKQNDTLPLAQVAQVAHWPMFRGAPELLGLATGRVPAKPHVKWTFKTEGQVRGSVSVAGGLAYFGAYDFKLYAVNIEDGKERWRFEGGDVFESTPLVLDGVLYAGCADMHFYALDAATGKLKWKKETGAKILGAPNYWKQEGGRTLILFGSYDARLYALDAATGEEAWNVQTGERINGCPAVSGGRAVFGGCDGLLHVVDLAKGEEEKVVPAGGYIVGSAALSEGRAYVGHYQNKFIRADLNKEEIVWAFEESNAPFASTPAVTKERVVFGGRDHKIYCLERATGKPVWSFATKGDVDGSPVVCGDRVICGSSDGRLYVLDLANGELAWSYETGGGIAGSPAVTAGVILVGTDDGAVLAFDEAPAGAGDRP